LRKNTASPQGEDDFFSKPAGPGLALSGHRATFAGEKEIVYVFLTILLGNVE
jgi:hypothetical protein